MTGRRSNQLSYESTLSLWHKTLFLTSKKSYFLFPLCYNRFMQQIIRSINSDFADFLKQLSDSHILDSVIVIIASFIIYKIITSIIFNKRKNSGYRLATSEKSRAYLHLLHNTLRYIFVIITTLLVLQINNINVSSLLAGVGIVGVVVGLSVQDALKDIIRGVTIISDGYFSLGDNVRYKDVEGRIVFLGIKTTKIKNSSDGSIVSIANRNIEQAEIVGGESYPSLPLPYELPLSQAEDIAKQVVGQLKDSKIINNCDFLGIGNFEDCFISYSFGITYNPNQRFKAKREFNRACLEVLEQHNITPPHRPVASNITLENYKSK